MSSLARQQARESFSRPPLIECGGRLKSMTNDHAPWRMALDRRSNMIIDSAEAA